MSSGEYVAENVIDADHRVTVLVSCYNEQPVVAKVVKVAADFRVAVAARVERLRALAKERGLS